MLEKRIRFFRIDNATVYKSFIICPSLFSPSSCKLGYIWAWFIHPLFFISLRFSASEITTFNHQQRRYILEYYRLIQIKSSMQVPASKVRSHDQKDPWLYTDPANRLHVGMRWVLLQLPIQYLAIFLAKLLSFGWLNRCGAFPSPLW